MPVSHVWLVWQLIPFRNGARLVKNSCHVRLLPVPGIHIPVALFLYSSKQYSTAITKLMGVSEAGIEMVAGCLCSTE